MQNIFGIFDNISLLSIIGDFFLGWEPVAIVFLVVGLALVVIEMFLPGFGVPGVSGAVCLIVSIILRSTSMTDALLTIAFIVILLAIAAFVVFTFFSRGGFARSPISLSDTIESSSSSLGSAESQALVGKKGVTLSELRPAGIATIDGKRYDVVTEGEFITTNSEIVVEHVSGIKIIVKAVK